MFKKIVLFAVIFMCVARGGYAMDISARSAVLMDLSTGNILWEKSPTLSLAMASTTKIMTAICAIENVNTNTPVKIDSAACGVEGSSIYLTYGEIITVKELLYGMLLNSGNDAATALAIAVGGSTENFVLLMNETALKIGAKNTHFTNPSGLYDDNHYTTAHDLALISAYAMKNPLFRHIVSTKEALISGGQNKSGRYLKNHNKLLWQYEGCTGIKTGFTKKSGRCLVSSAQKDGTELISVTLCAPNDWQDHKKLLDFGFSKS